MKKILLLFVAVATLASCSKDDPAPAPIDPIVGTWIHTSSKTENTMTNAVFINELSPCASLASTTFFEDTTGQEKNYYQSAAGSCNYVSDTVFFWGKTGMLYSINAGQDSVPFNATFSSNGNTMTMVANENYYKMTNVYTRQ